MKFMFSSTLQFSSVALHSSALMLRLLNAAASNCQCIMILAAAVVQGFLCASSCAWIIVVLRLMLRALPHNNLLSACNDADVCVCVCVCMYHDVCVQCVRVCQCVSIDQRLAVLLACLFLFCLLVCLSLCLSVCLSGWLSFDLSVCLCVCLSFCLSFCLSGRLHSCMPQATSFCPPAYMPVLKCLLLSVLLAPRSLGLRPSVDRQRQALAAEVRGGLDGFLQLFSAPFLLVTPFTTRIHALAFTGAGPASECRSSPAPPPTPGGAGSVADYISEAQFESIFLHRNDPACEFTQVAARAACTQQLQLPASRQHVMLTNACLLTLY